MTEQLIVRGGCQCGAVRYSVCLERDEAYYCHCRMCQKAFGNLFGVFCKAEERGVCGRRGGSAYFHSSRIARRGLCRECGSPLTFEYLDGRDTHLAVGALDEPGCLRPGTLARVGGGGEVSRLHPTLLAD